jgi:hypothetical protein
MARALSSDCLFEGLEPRTLLSTFTVTNTGNAGSGSLRQAILDANTAPGADVVEFDSSLNGQTISWTSGEVLITDELTINGPGAANLSIDALGSGRVFHNQATTAIAGLTIKNGTTFSYGGAIYNTAALTLSGVVLSDNQSFGHGAAVGTEVDSTLVMVDSTISGGGATGWGGGIYAAPGSSVTLTGCTITGPTAADGGAVYLDSSASLAVTDSTVQTSAASGRGGAIFADGTSTITISGSTFTGNSAGSEGGAVCSISTGAVTITDGVFTGNSSLLGGALAFINDAILLTLTRVEVNFNDATAGSGGGIFAAVDTLTLTDSTIYGNTAAGAAGGMYAEALAFLMSGSTVSDNTATEAGGGILVDGGTATTFTNSTLSGNVSLDDTGGGLFLVGGIHNWVGLTITFNVSVGAGGGVYGTSNSTIEMRDSTLSSNTTSAGPGGGIVIQTGSVTLADSTVSLNSASGPGGGVLVYQAQAAISGSTISDNTAADGAGLYALNATVSILGTTVSGNQASGNGAGLAITGVGVFILDTSTVRDNTTPALGGGVYLDETAVAITASTISGNTAMAGGGIFTRAAMNLTNSTISGNTASREGGGIYISAPGLTGILASTIARNHAEGEGGDPAQAGGGFRNTSSQVLLRSTILAQNTRDTGAANDFIGDSVDPASEYNLIGDAATAGGLTHGAGNNIVGADPLLGDLADNGGPTMTHALPSGSPAIDAGSNPLSLTTDQRSDRFGRASGAPDIGAYERQALALVVDTASDTSDGDYTAGNLSLREAIRLANANPLGDAVAFDDTLSGSTITLGGVEITITGAVSIDGPGMDLLVIDAAGASRHFVVDDGDSGGLIEVSISGLHLRNGATTGSGGSINSSETLSLDHVRLTSNTATDDGGAIRQLNASLTVASSVINDNSAGDSGGAIDGDGAAVISITGSILRRNTAGGDSGAVDNDATLAITTTDVSGNTAGARGGAIGSIGTLTIDRSVLSDNAAGTLGGAVSALSGSIQVTDSTFSANTAGTGAGLYLSTLTQAAIGRSLFAGNNASQFGGAIYAIDLPLTISNSTFSANAAAQGGGGLAVQAGAGAITITNSTITANSAQFGGGLYVSGTGTVLRSTIVSGNTSGSNPSDISNSTVTGSNNLIGDAGTAGGLANGVNGNLVGVDPLLGDLADNGGPTLTHALLPGSPAIDAGTNTDALATDQRGETRVRGAGADIGAFEGTARPTVATIQGDATQVTQGEALVLRATGVADSDGSVVAVRYSVDLDGDGIADEVLGTSSDTGADFAFTVSGLRSRAFPLTGVTFLAEAVDDEGYLSIAATLDTQVLYSLRADGGSIVGGSSTSDDNLWTAIVNEAGDVVVLETDAGLAYHLGLQAGAPGATGDPIVFTDPKDGLVYVAYPAADGLILAKRDAGGAWSYRNLSSALGVAAADSPARALTSMVSTARTGRVVIMAGLDADGRLVGFQQNDATIGWSFIDISADLDSQGMATPVFTDLISYVTPWNAWNIAGIDGDGNIQGVWVAPASFTTWRVDNLSQITGAPPMTGQLTVTQTAWSAINLGGVNSSGHLVVTWWVPSFKGSWVTSDLTNASGGETLVAGRATGFVTPWGAINYAGLNADGEVAAYWWTPQINRWTVTPLTARFDDTMNRPTGAMASHVSAAGTMSLLGLDDEGDVTRVWWTPNDDGRWKLTDMTAAATRA